MDRVVKTSSPAEVPGYEKAYWHAKTPLERLDAALELILFAKAIYHANPPFDDGKGILKSDSPIDRRRFF